MVQSSSQLPTTCLIHHQVTSRHDGQVGKGTPFPAGLEMSVEVVLPLYKLANVERQRRGVCVCVRGELHVRDLKWS